MILFLAARSRDPVANGRRGGSEGRGGRGVQVREGKGGCHHLLASLLSSSSVRGRSVQVSGIVVVIIFCQHQHSSQTSEFIFQNDDKKISRGNVARLTATLELVQVDISRSLSSSF